jgi:hypothetical protein
LEKGETSGAESGVGPDADDLLALTAVFSLRLLGIRDAGEAMPG